MSGENKERYKLQNRLGKKEGRGLKIYYWIEDTETGAIFDGLTKACEEMNRLNNERITFMAKEPKTKNV